MMGINQLFTNYVQNGKFPDLFKLPEAWVHNTENLKHLNKSCQLHIISIINFFHVAIIFNAVIIIRRAYKFPDLNKGLIFNYAEKCYIGIIRSIFRLYKNLE